MFRTKIITIENSTLYYHNEMYEFQVDRFDETIGLGDIPQAEAIAIMKQIEE